MSSPSTLSFSWSWERASRAHCGNVEESDLAFYLNEKREREREKYVCSKRILLHCQQSLIVKSFIYIYIYIYIYTTRRTDKARHSS